MAALIPREKWEWFGSPAHFICSNLCRYHLATKVGPWIVSTVGEMWPSRSSREIHAKYTDEPWLKANVHLLGDAFDHAYMKRFGYEEIGYGRKYETMVFKAGKRCKAKGCNCGLPSLADANELDSAIANDAGTAHANHHRLCKKWAKKEKP